jgi:hypothetical protein
MILGEGRGSYKGHDLEYAEQGNVNRRGSKPKFDDQKVDTGRVRQLGSPPPPVTDTLWPYIRKLLLGDLPKPGGLSDQPGMAPIPGAPVKPPVYTKEEQATWEKWNAKMDEWEKWRKERERPRRDPRLKRKTPITPLPRNTNRGD